MWSKFNLRTRVYTILSLLVVITLLGGVVMVWYTYRMQGLMNRIIDRDLTAFEAAVELETDLATQKGFVSYYFIDGNPEWLNKLAKHRLSFRAQVGKALSLTETKEQESLIARIGTEYAKYTALKDQVIGYYGAEEMEKGKRLHETLRPLFSNILDLCGKYKELSRKTIQEVQHKSSIQARKLRIISAAAILIVLILGILLAFVLVHDILQPVRLLVQETIRDKKQRRSGDEVRALKKGVHGLIEEYDHTYFELEKSREYLLQSEKMAMVGKLAAGTSHSIRNPLTSVKMRLFSLGRSLDLDSAQQEDFDVISEEIGHIDNILQNFLEFSRPPRLKLQMISPSEVVDQTTLLLRHRLESCNGTLTIERAKPLPEVQADPEQLKEVFVNIVVNACEAVQDGVIITIREEEKSIDDGNRVAIIRIIDNGPGIPKRIREKIFEPFFTTKEEGSGLGLSIVVRIIQEHGGSVSIETEEEKGASFVIMLPITSQKESVNEHDPDH
jgi:signal transduction histidine kinase